jgi:hypothetical protein
VTGIARRFGICGLLVLGASGCACSYDDSAGNRHIFGLVDVTIPAPARSETLAGNVVAVTTIGALVSRNAQGSTLALGYARETTAAIRDNALVLGNPGQAAEVISMGNIRR